MDNNIQVTLTLSQETAESLKNFLTESGCTLPDQPSADQTEAIKLLLQQAAAARQSQEIACQKFMEALGKYPLDGGWRVVFENISLGKRRELVVS